MGLTINPTITFNGKEAQEGILERAYRIPGLAQIHSIYENIVAKEQIAFLERFSKVTVADTGCGTGKSVKTLPMYEKFWEPVDVKIWLQPCWKDFKASFFVWTMRKGIERADISETDLAEYIIEVLTFAVKDDALRLLWFGDKNISHDGASPAGTLADSDDVKYYNLINGFWKQIYEGVAIGAGTHGHIPRHEITKNAGVSYTAQALADAESLTIFKALLNNADKRLRHNDQKIIICTDSIFSNWQDYKESKVLETSWKQQDFDMEAGVFRSTPILPMEFWDRHIDSDFNNGTVWHLPHRAVLTTVNQLAAGFDSVDAIDSFKAFLDDTTELYNIKGGYKIDAKIMENHMFSVAY